MWTSQFSTLPKTCNNSLHSHGSLHAEPSEGFSAPLLEFCLRLDFGPIRAFVLTADSLSRRSAGVVSVGPAGLPLFTGVLMYPRLSRALPLLVSVALFPSEGPWQLRYVLHAS